MTKYYIAFDTQEDPAPSIEAITIELRQEVVSDMDMEVRIDLVDDPLYTELVKYVKNNPVRKRKVH